MAFQIINQTASPALRGQDALVQVQDSELTKLALLTATGPGTFGTKVTVSSSGNIGYVSEIPTSGHEFKFKPANPDGRVDSIQPGILSANEILTIG